ncbi:MAG: AMP-binding protein, partial [Acetobacteraceae bacterium]|nr:AMP-binding protein [Acetobacteraceae bacterium]
MSGSGQAFLDARDLLLRHRCDLHAARHGFRWPKLERFNWALDYFDRMAAGNEQAALRFVGPDTEASISFAALSRRSNQVANHLRALGVTRGDRILMLLGNVQPLWEVMLAAMKLGAVLIPATTMLTEDDLRDRLTRGRVRHVIAASDLAPRFASLPGDYTKIALGPAPGWLPFEESTTASAAFAPDGETRASDPLLLYFTSGTTSKPKLVLHSHE